MPGTTPSSNQRLRMRASAKRRPTLPDWPASPDRILEARRRDPLLLSGYLGTVLPRLSTAGKDGYTSLETYPSLSSAGESPHTESYGTITSVRQFPLTRSTMRSEFCNYKGRVICTSCKAAKHEAVLPIIFKLSEGYRRNLVPGRMLFWFLWGRRNPHSTRTDRVQLTYNIQGVPRGMCQTSGGYSLCLSIPI